MDSAPLRLAVLGAGAVGLGSAALAISRGHAATVWSPRGGSLDATLTARGALALTAGVAVARSCADAVAGADAVLLAIPATGYRTVLDALAAVLPAGMPVLISGHLSFAALYLAQALQARGIAAPIAAWGTTAVSGRLGAGGVDVSSVRAEVDVAAVPDAAAPAMLALCRRLFGERFRERPGLVAIALSNVNPQNHLAIALCNFTRMEKGEDWRQNDHITAAVGRLMEALDEERLAIASAFGVEVRTLRRHFALSFHTPEAPLGEMAAALAARGSNPAAPRSLDTRYVLEDAPYGLHPTALLGRLCGRPAVLHEAGLAMLSALYGRDLAADNDILPQLGPLTAARLGVVLEQAA